MATVTVAPMKPRGGGGVIPQLSPENFRENISSSSQNNNSPPQEEASSPALPSSTSHPFSSFRQQHTDTPPLLQTPFQQKRFAQQAGHLPDDGDGEIEGDCTSPFSSKLYGNDESVFGDEFTHSGNNTPISTSKRRNQSLLRGPSAAIMNNNNTNRRVSRRATVVSPKIGPPGSGSGSGPISSLRKDFSNTAVDVEEASADTPPPHPPPPSARRASISTKDTIMRRLSTFQSRSTTAINTLPSSTSGIIEHNKLVLPTTPGGGLVGSSSFATPPRRPRMGSVLNSNGTSASTYLGIQGSAGLAACSPRVPAPPRRPTDTQLQHIKSVSANRGVFRTFDKETGALTHHSLDSFPSVVSLTRTQYNDHISDPQMQEQARLHVAGLSLEKQVRLAVGSIRRHHANNSARRKHADVFDKESNEGRMAAMLNIEVDDLISHLGKETERLSRMRIERAAADEHLMNLARLEAKRKVAVLEEKLLPDALPMVDLLRLQLDACRRMPEPPRQMLPPDPPKQKKKASPNQSSSGGINTTNGTHNNSGGHSSRTAANMGHIKRAVGAVVRIAGIGGSGGSTGGSAPVVGTTAVSTSRRSVMPLPVTGGMGKSVTIDLPPESAF